MQKVKIIAEIAQGYEGDINLCKRFIGLGKRSGADGVKFQIFEAGEVSLPSYKHYDLFKSLYIHPEEWKKIIELSNENGIEFYADVFGINTLNWLLECPISGIKIHSTDLKNYQLLNALKDRGIRLILGVGGTTLEEIEKVLDILGDNEIIIMSGFQAEPNLVEDIELNKIAILKNKFRTKVGYADHLDVNNTLTKGVPAMAVLMGADYIEKHLTIERNYLQLEDYISALNPEEFQEMVNLIRGVENFPDPFCSAYEFSDREEAYRKGMKKVLLSGHLIEKHSIISESDLVMLRTDEEYNELLDLDTIVGKIAKETIPKHKVIRKEHLL